jgi:hypothetical protein
MGAVMARAIVKIIVWRAGARPQRRVQVARPTTTGPGRDALHDAKHHR